MSECIEGDTSKEQSSENELLSCSWLSQLQQPWGTTQSHTSMSSGSRSGSKCQQPSAMVQNGKQDIPGRRWECRRGSDSLVSLFQLWRQKPRWWFFTLLTLFFLSCAHLLKSNRKGKVYSPLTAAFHSVSPALVKNSVNKHHTHKTGTFKSLRTKY